MLNIKMCWLEDGIVLSNCKIEFYVNDFDDLEGPTTRIEFCPGWDKMKFIRRYPRVSYSVC